MKDRKLVILGVALATMIGMNAYSLWQLRALEKKVTGLETKLAHLNDVKFQKVAVDLK